MSTVNLNSNSSMDTSKDNIVIVNLLEDIAGGRTLNVAGISEEVLKAGRVIISQNSNGDFKPLNITAGVYDDLPAGHTYRGILVASVLKSKAMASIMVRGTVNEKAAEDAAGLPPYKAACKTALEPLIRFTED